MRPRGLRAPWRKATPTYWYEPKPPTRAAEKQSALAEQLTEEKSTAPDLQKQAEPGGSMRNGMVTPVSSPAVVPVVYLDLSMEPANADEQNDEITDAEICGITAYPGLQALLLTKHGPEGKPVYRVEGSLPQLIKWLRCEYNSGNGVDKDSLLQLEAAKLAR
jgi:hypothetical protein